MPGPIIAIGGGELKDLETLPIDREIVRLAKKKKPRALFIPTASHDAPGYCETFHAIYGKKLGCVIDILLLTDKQTTQRQMKEKIAAADLIYVGGGNTLYMMNLWRKRGVAKELEKAWQRGTVMAGLSAGSICWFEKGLSDSRKNRWTYVTGLGFIAGYHSPHMAREPERRAGFEKMMRQAPVGTVGYAIEDGCAVIFEKGKERVITAKKTASTYTYNVTKTGKATAAVFRYRTDDLSVRPYIQRFEREYRKLREFFSVTPPPLTVDFIYTRAEMSRHWGKPAPRWLSGMVDNDDPYRIYVYSPTVIERHTDETKAVIMPTVIHETAHAFVTKLNERCYYWINEGICQVLEGKKLTQSPVTAAQWRWFLQRNGLTDPDLSWRETVDHGGYEIAHRLTAYLLKTQGKAAVIGLIKIRRVPDPRLGKKMQRWLGMPVEEFLKEAERRAMRIRR